MSTILITGASSGIGAALALAYAQRGDNVIACGRNIAALTQLTEQHALIESLSFDITKDNEIEQAADSVAAIDILILNAGDCQYIDDVMHFDAQKYRHVLSVNLLSMGSLLQAFLPKLSPGGRVVFISSLATLLPFSRNQAYGTSKAGLNYLARSLAVDLAPQGISVTLVQPGFVKTPLTERNNFAMPFIISSEQAANRIISGLGKGHQHIEFPKRLVWLLKVLSWLPTSWCQYLLRNND